MTTDEIRQRFLDFFKKKGHTIVESDTVVPKEDPTVLFTTAGMQQFKRQFLGYTDEYTRAASCQKCLRTDDLDEVGKTNFHHTFFEMLGNFSFGDYFKKEAIEWGWKFFTQELKIPADKLWASVYKDDKEAEKIWKNDIKDFDSKKLLKLGDHDNFWPADAREKGPNGPCGPCSEIFYDFGENPECTNKKCDPSCDCGRFGEIWNLVFTQFERKEGGILEPLPNKNIDTGMGLERLAAVMQGKTNNYDIDIFEPIFAAIKKHIDPDGKNLSHEEGCKIADHIRGIVFGICDGVVPSNEGRGYVIKKLIIDIADIALRAGNKKPVIHTLVSSVVEAMKTPYPELKKKEKEIAEIVESVEKAYIKVRKKRLPEFKKQLEAVNSADELGALIFKFRDTYGLALNTLEHSIQDAGVDQKIFKNAWKNFESLMEKQQEQSRASSKMGGDVFADKISALGVPKTKFLGYDHAHSTSTVLALLVDGNKVNEVKKGDNVQVFLDKTPFYAESGGQVGDVGAITKETSRIEITDTQKFEDIFIHFGKVTDGHIKVNDQVTAQIEIERRQAIMRNHTATHLLQAALRDILGTHVKQQGSLVDEDRLRFDFTHPKAITTDEITKIERDVNTMILSNIRLVKEFMDIEEAKDSGALAFFAEKYGKTVRIVSIGNLSKEFCGGTHVDATGEIGLLKIVSEGAIAQGIRRLEAKTGMGAWEHIKEEEQQLDEISRLLKSSRTEIKERVQQQAARLKKLEKDTAQLRLKAIKGSLDDVLKKAEIVNGTQLISYAFDDVEMDILRRVSDMLKQKSKSAVIVLGAKSQENASLLISVSDDLVKKGLNANDLIKDVAPLMGGSGGGRPQMAQAGSKDTSKVDKALKEASKLIKNKIPS